MIPVPAGSTFLLYTDGATDITGPEGEFFGLERLQALAQAALSGPDGPGILWRNLARADNLPGQQQPG